MISLLVPSSLVLAEGSLIEPNPGLSFWTLVTFLLVAVVLRWKVWGPLMHTIEAREKNIQEAVDQAAKERAQAETLLAEQQKAIADARKESAEMVRKSQAEVERAKTELFAQARKEADAFLSQARKQIQDEKAQALSEVRAVAVDLAINAAQKLLQRNLDDATQRQLAEDYIKGMASAQGQGGQRLSA